MAAESETTVEPGDVFSLSDVPYDEYGKDALGTMWHEGSEDAQVVGFAIRESSRCCCDEPQRHAVALARHAVRRRARGDDRPAHHRHHEQAAPGAGRDTAAGRTATRRCGSSRRVA